MLHDSCFFAHNEPAFYLRRKGTPSQVEDTGDGVTYVAYYGTTGSGKMRHLENCRIRRNHHHRVGGGRVGRPRIAGVCHAY